MNQYSNLENTFVSRGHQVQVTLFAWSYAKVYIFYVHSQHWNYRIGELKELLKEEGGQVFEKYTHLTHS